MDFQPSSGETFVRFAQSVAVIPAVALALGISLPVNAQPQPPIDATPAVVIGDYPVSNYIVAKYYGRFAEPIRREQRREPTADESAAWLRRFLTQQVVIADAISCGYGDRPEVKDIVDRMERHMLTQPSGPYYQQICPQQPATVGQLRAAFARTAHIYDARIAHFSDETAARAQLGPDVDAVPLDEQTARVDRAIAQDPAVERLDGPCGWPFVPWLELSDVIPGLEPGRWRIHRDPALGLYAILIRSVQARPAGDFEVQQAAFREIELHVRQQTFQRRHQAEALKAAAFAIDGTVAAQFVAAYIRIAPGAMDLPPEITRPIADRPLCTYRIDVQPMAMTAEDFRILFSRQFIRAPLGSEADLRARAAAMVLAELDLRAARKAGVDRTPQFVQDRIGFTGFQVLDVYEKQVLLPLLKLGQPEIETFYREHAAEFARPSRVRGRLLEFSTAEAAAAWLRHGPAGEPTASGLQPASQADVEVTTVRPLRGLESFTPVFLMASDGMPLGPFPVRNRFAVFVKEQTLERTPPPLAEIEPLIRERAFRPALDRREAELAREFAARQSVTDHVDYGRYGVTAAQVQPPWKS